MTVGAESESLLPSVVKSQAAGGEDGGSFNQICGKEEIFQCIIGQRPTINVLMGDVTVCCLLDTVLMVTTITEFL